VVVDPESAKVAIKEIRVEAMGFVARCVGPLTDSDDPQSAARVVLDRATSQRGRVRFRDGSPAAFARVVAGAMRSDSTTGVSFLATAKAEDLSPSMNELDLILSALPPRAGNQTLEGTVTDEKSGVAVTDFSLELERDGRVFEAERIAPG
jgi:hypothetical protein